MKRLSITAASGGSVVSRPDGERLRAELERHWQEEDILEVDFENRRIASVSFLDEGIAMLALTRPVEEIKGKLRFVNMKALDRDLLEQRLAARARERASSMEP